MKDPFKKIAILFFIVIIILTALYVYEGLTTGNWDDNGFFVIF